MQHTMVREHPEQWLWPHRRWAEIIMSHANALGGVQRLRRSLLMFRH
jgi:hypothetical protein